MQTNPNRGPDAAETTTTPKSLGNPAEFRKRANSAACRDMKRVGRDVHRAFMTIGHVAGVEPDECNAAFALDELLYDMQGQDTETPRRVPLAEIGKTRISRKDASENKSAGWQKAQRDISHLFVHVYPRIGLAMQTREKGLNLGDGHMYASRWMNIAVMVAADFDAERSRILSSKDINREDKGRLVGEALERLATESLVLFDKLDTVIIEKNKPFAVVTGPQAVAFKKQNAELFEGPKPAFKTASYTYTPPPEPRPDTGPFREDDFDRMIDQDVSALERRLDTIAARNTPEEARLYLERWLSRTRNTAKTWDVSNPDTPHTENGTYIENKELQYTHENEYPPTAADAADDTGGGVLKNEYGSADNSNEDSHLKVDELQFDGFGASFPQGQVNFDTPLEAAEFYVRDGWAIIPTLDRKPLIGGKVKGQGHTAACRDKGKVRDYFTVDFPKANGLAIRLDEHILLDFDVKNGGRGIEAYELLDGTFGLPATLTQSTHTGGLHLIFKLPDGLPEGYLGNWTALLDGFDIKTGVGGICHAEPTVTAKGVYRWIDPTAEIAELPRAVCDYIHELHEAQQKKPDPRESFPQGLHVGPFDPNVDQSKFVKDMPKGERHPRLRSVACGCARLGATAEQIVSVLKFHDSKFTEPTNDLNFIARVAEGAVTKFGLGVAS